MFAVALLLVVGIFAALHFYLAKKICGGLRYFFPRLPLYAVLIPFGLLLILFFCGLLARGLLQAVGACVMGVFFVFLEAALFSDGLFLLLYPLTRQRLQKALRRALSAGLAVALTLVFSAVGFLAAGQVSVTEYRLSETPSLRIAFFSDLHLGAAGSEERLERIVRAVNEQKPDVVLIGGDIFDSDFTKIADPDRAAAHLAGLESRYGTFACAGNHDAGETVPQMLAFLEQCGIRLLRDEAVTVEDRFVLVGRRDRSPIGSFDGKERLPMSEIPLPEGDLPVIVLDHNPAEADTYGSDVRLVLSGHTHKGQIFPAGLVTELLFPIDYGLTRFSPAGPQVIVSSGIGYWGMPLRLFTQSELVFIEL